MKKWLMIISIVMGFINPAVAQKMQTLYQAEVPVSSQSDTERAQAVKKGLVEVLTKLTGTQHFENNPTLQTAVEKKSDYYLQEFSYGSSQQPTLPFILKATYDAKAVKRLLKNAGISYWSHTRPLILVWVVVSSQADNAEIISNGAANSLPAIVKQNAQKYGIPMILPIMDTIDMEHITSQDILASSLPVLKEAAKRYTPDGMLIGKVNIHGDTFESQWELILDDGHWSWTFAEKNTEGMIAALMENLSHTLAKQYAVANTQIPQHQLTLVVTHITQRSDLVTLMRFLKQLTPVQQVQLSQISSDEVELSVTIRGSIEAFQQNTILGQHLINQQDELASNKLIYEWSP